MALDWSLPDLLNVDEMWQMVKNAMAYEAKGQFTLAL